MKTMVLFFMTFFSFILVFPLVGLAQGKREVKQQALQNSTIYEAQAGVDDQDTGEQGQGKAGNQNQGKKRPSQVVTHEAGDSQTGEEEISTKSGARIKTVNSRSDNARLHMSYVAQKVEELLTTQGAKGGIGEQVRTFAQQQHQIQQQVREQFAEMEQRRGWVKRLFGPNFKAVKSLERLLNQNQLRIAKLEELQNQVTDEALQAKIQETIQALTQQNTALQGMVQTEEKIGSLFGWLLKFFNK